MIARYRSRFGFLLAVFMLPALLGVMACLDLPAPVGDPERSRIDPALSGAWVWPSDEGWVFIFEPYDKRTWLVRFVDLSVADDVADEPEEAEGPEQAKNDRSLEEIVTVEKSGPSILALIETGELKIFSISLMKAWRKRISGRSFITFEFRGMIDKESGLEPYVWWVAKAELVDESNLSLQFVNQDLEGIEAGMTRSQLERLIRRNLDNPELLFVGDPWLLERVSQDDFGVLAEMLKDFGVMPEYE